MTRKESLKKDLCFVCGKFVPQGSGIFHGGLRILFHAGICGAKVTAEERIYDRSAKGRWRPNYEVLLRLRSARHSPLEVIQQEVRR